MKTDIISRIVDGINLVADPKIRIKTLQDKTTSGFNSIDWTELRLDIDKAVNPDIVGTITDMS